jgi:hypothetical protein
MNNILYTICKFMIHLHTKFHMSSSNGSLLTAVTLKAKRNFHMAAILFLHSRKVPQKSCIFFEDLLPYTFA